MSQLSAIEQTARKERLSAIGRCRRCDPCGWQLDTDGTPIEPAVRCDHGVPTTPPRPVRDITEPIHQSEDNQ